MRIAVAGAGALGSVVGGLLARAGADVVLLAHGRHADALARGPLELRLPDETVEVDVGVADAAEADVVLLTAKRFDSAAALARVGGRPRLALSLQNGVGKNVELVERFGGDVVAPAATTVAAHLVAPGVAASPTLGITYLGGAVPAASELVAMLAGAGLQAGLVADGAAAEWSKLAHVASSMAVQALVRRPLHELFRRRASACLLRQLIEEVGAVATAEGSSLADLPGLLPVATLAAATEDDAAAFFAERAAALERAGATSLRTSMLASIEAGRRTELETIHGELVRRAAARLVDARALETCYRLALLLDVPR